MWLVFPWGCRVSALQFTYTGIFFCIFCRRTLVSVPNYLDQQTVKRYHEVRRSVEQRLHNYRVQGVVSMFNELRSEEKEECLKILQKTNGTITIIM